MRKPSVSFIRVLARLKLRAKGYSTSQINNKMSKIGDGTFLEWIKKYGPTILAILQAIIPIILALFGDEPPDGDPIPELDDDALILDEETGNTHLSHD